MSPCEVLVPFFGVTCGELLPHVPARPVRRICLHEHVRDGMSCDMHIEQVANGGCRTCYDLDGHDCPISVMPIEAVQP